MARRVLGLMVGVLVLTLAVTGCGGETNRQDSGQVSNEKESVSAAALRVGVIQPLSGPVAQSGQNVLWGAEIAVDKINAEGGVLGRPIELVVYDSKNDPADAVNAAQKLITGDRVNVIMGCWGSSPTLAVLPIVEKAGIPIVVETSSSPKITEQGYKMVFRIAATSVQEAEGIKDALFKNVNIRKAAFIAVNNDWGRGGVEAYSTVIKEQGGEVVSVEYVGEEVTEFYSQLTKIKDSGADTIFINSEVSQIALVVKQVRELKLPQNIISVGGSNFSDALIELAGKEAAEGVWSVQHSIPWIPDKTPNPERARSYLESWTKANYPWLGVQEGVRGFDGIYTIAEAVKVAKGSDDPKDLVPALRSLDFKGVASRIKFNEKGQSEVQMYLVRVVDGKTVLVE
ncbi:penicillin-binding protein activator [Moorellaceae bacterium AZ2]